MTQSILFRVRLITHLMRQINEFLEATNVNFK